MAVSARVELLIKRQEWKKTYEEASVAWQSHKDSLLAVPEDHLYAACNCPQCSEARETMTVYAHYEHLLNVLCRKLTVLLDTVPEEDQLLYRNTGQQ